MRRWKMNIYNDAQKHRRESIDASQLLTHGCIPMDDYAAEVVESLQSSAVAFTTLWESGQMPVLKYDNDFRLSPESKVPKIDRITIAPMT